MKLLKLCRRHFLPLTFEKELAVNVRRGDGPVDAVFHAINAAVGFEVDLKDYQLRSVTAGQDAMGEASVSVRQGSRSFNGRGVSTDVVEASAKAYLNALNKMISECGVPAAKEAG